MGGIGRAHYCESTHGWKTNVQMLNSQLLQGFLAFCHDEVTKNKRVYETQAATAYLRRKTNQAVASAKHSSLKILLSLSADQAHEEFAHINAALLCICDTYKSTMRDSSQLCCTGRHSLYGSPCKTTSYFLKHIPSGSRLLFH